MATTSEESGGSGENFWEIDGFKRTVRRTEDGLQQCNEMIKLIQERAEIEDKYAKRLRVWAKKWADVTEKGEVSIIYVCIFFITAFSLVDWPFDCVELEYCIS